MLCRQLFFPVLVLKTVERFTLSGAKMTSFLLLKCMACCSCTGLVLLTGPLGGQLVPDTPSSVPPPLVFPTRVVARVVSHPFCLRGLPPFRAS